MKLFMSVLATLLLVISHIQDRLSDFLDNLGNSHRKKDVKSITNKGTTFAIHLPIVQSI